MNNFNCNRLSPKRKSQLAHPHQQQQEIVTDYRLNANHNEDLDGDRPCEIVTDYRLNANHNSAPVDVKLLNDCNRLSPKRKSQQEPRNVHSRIDCNRLSPKRKSQQIFVISASNFYCNRLSPKQCARIYLNSMQWYLNK